jgi:hypothetical protein
MSLGKSTTSSFSAPVVGSVLPVLCYAFLGSALACVAGIDVTTTAAVRRLPLYTISQRGDLLTGQIYQALPKGSMIAVMSVESDDGTTRVLTPDVAIRFADLNGDGQLDVVAGVQAIAPGYENDPLPYYCYLVVLLRKDVYTLERVWESGPLAFHFFEPYYLSVLDINDDGALEMVSSETGFGFWGMHIWRWDTPKKTAVKLYSGMAKTKDLDGDGVVEILDWRINKRLKFWGGSEAGVCPVILKWEGKNYQDVSRHFPEIYRALIPNYQKEAARYEDHPDSIERVGCAVLIARCYYLLGNSKKYAEARAHAIRVLEEFEHIVDIGSSKEFYAKAAREVVREFLPENLKR